MCSFNDDIQGTGSVTLAAIMAATATTRTRLRDQRVVILRAGSAAAGIAGQLLNAMMTDGLSAAAAKERVWLADSRGLVHDGRNDLDSSKAGNASSAFEERITARMWTPRYLPYRRVTAALQD